MRRLYWQLRNLALTVRFWFQGYTWREARVKVCMVRICAALAKLAASESFAVYRTNRPL